LHIATLALRLEVIKLLVDAGADIDAPCYHNARGSSALHIAVMESQKNPQKSLEIIEYFVSKKARCYGVVDGGRNPLQTACEQGLEAKIVKLLLDNYPNADTQVYDYNGASFYCFSNATALHFALKCQGTLFANDTSYSYTKAIIRLAFRYPSGHRSVFS